MLDPLFVDNGIHVGYYTCPSKVEGGKDITICSIGGHCKVVRATRILFRGLRNHHVHSWDTFASVSSPRKTKKLEALEKMFIPGDVDDIKDDDDSDDDGDDDGGNEDFILDMDYLEEKMFLHSLEKDGDEEYQQDEDDGDEEYVDEEYVDEED